MENQLNSNETEAGSQRAKVLFAILLIAAFPLIGFLFKNHILSEPAEDRDNSSPLETTSANAPPTNVVDSLISVSLVYLQSNRPAQSLEPLKRVIQLSPGNAAAYNNLGLAYTMMGQFQNGINACSTALALAPDFQLAANNLKWAQDEKNKVLQEIALMESDLVQKKSKKMYIELGLNYFKIGEYDKSIALWKKILDFSADDPDALLNIGMGYMMKEQYDEAIPLFQKICANAPENELARNNLNWALSEKQKSRALNP